MNMKEHIRIMKKLAYARVETELEYLINSTPTSEERNLLTEANLKLLEAESMFRK